MYDNSDAKYNNVLLIQSSFSDTLTALHKVNVSLPENPTPVQIDLQQFIFPPNGQLVTVVDEIAAINLEPRNGSRKMSSDRIIASYDESMNKFSCLEGSAYLISHSLIVTGETDFYPTGLLTFYFYTRSKDITNKSDFLKYSTDPDMDSKKDYIHDKIELLTKHTPPRSILLIDGPLIGGDVYTYMIRAIHEFLAKDIIPVFFVKNSSSNLVTDNIGGYFEKFNSDMHWAFKFLKKGQRTNFFKYVDKNNPDNAKIFCYLKAYDASPQRIEFHIDTFNKYREEIESIMDLILYLILVQGNLKNPQVRPIAIAEQYARELIRLADINKYFYGSGLIPTINQERFGW